MPRKEKQASETEKEVFPTILRGLMSERKLTQNDVAQGIGMTRQVISLYCMGQSTPDINTLSKMADFFDVSCDYLLGRTTLQTPDVVVQDICKRTGLSERAIEVLVNTKEWRESERMDFWNWLIENKEFFLDVFPRVQSIATEKAAIDGILPRLRVQKKSQTSLLGLEKLTDEYWIHIQKNYCGDKFIKLMEGFVEEIIKERANFVKERVSKITPEQIEALQSAIFGATAFYKGGSSFSGDTLLTAGSEAITKLTQKKEATQNGTDNKEKK